MTSQLVLNDINLLRAHASEALKIADRLTHRIGTAGVSTPATPKRKGLTDEQKAKFLAKKNRNKK